MKRSKWSRITAAYLAVALFIGGFIFIDPVQAFSADVSYGISGMDKDDSVDEDITDNESEIDQRDDYYELALGRSGTDDDLDFSDLDKPDEKKEEVFPLGMSVDRASLDILAPIEIGNFTDLYKLLHKETGTYYIVLTDDILMEKNITIADDTVLVIDGQGHTIQQNHGTKGFFSATKRVDITLKNMDIYGTTYYGIVRGDGGAKSYQTVRFEDIYYRGPALYCSYLDKGTTCIITNCTIDILDVSDIYSSTTLVNEAVEATDLIFDGGETVINHMMEGKKKSSTSLFWIQCPTDGTGGMSLINGAHVTLNSKNYIIYAIDAADAYLDIDDDCTLIVNSTAFNCDKTLKGYELNRIRIGENARFEYTQRGTPYYSPGSPQIRVRGDFVMEPGSVFLYDTENKKGGFEHNNGSIILNSPALVSIYNPTAAFQKSGALGVKTGDWQVNDVDMVHYWSASTANSSIANPANDLVNFAPEYTWLTKDEKTTFSFNGTFPNGVTYVSRELENKAPNSLVGTLAQKLTLNATAQRLVIGAPEGVTIVEPEVLELVAVPSTLYYGEHKLPAVTTVYAREVCDSTDEDGNMIVQVKDTRIGAAPWTLTVEVDQVFTDKKNNITIDSALVFINDGEKVPLSGSPYPIYTPAVNSPETEYTLTWGDNEGLLAEIKPGMAKAGEYTAVVKWNLQVTP